jgi:hypothetical protein
MSVPRPPFDTASHEEARVKALLNPCLEMLSRPPSVKAATWHQLSGRLPDDGARSVHRHGAPRRFVLACTLSGLGMVSLLIYQRSSERMTFHDDVATAESPAAKRAEPVTDSVGNRPGWRSVDLGPIGTLSLSPSASLQLPADEATGQAAYEVVLDDGELCAVITHRDLSRQGPFVVRANVLRAVVVGTRFCVSSGTTADATWVSVEEGRVRVERGRKSVEVGAGGLVRSDDPRLTVAASASNRSNMVACSLTAPLAERRRCLTERSKGDDVAAQNALYMLGNLAREQDHDGAGALSIWRTYRHRFPAGALATEVDLAILDELLAEKRFNEALNSTDDFLRRYPSYFLAPHVRLERAELLRSGLARPADAAEAYQRILSSESDPNVRDEALYGLGLSREATGSTADVTSIWRQYRRDFPRGKHASEVANRLSTKAVGVGPPNAPP